MTERYELKDINYLLSQEKDPDKAKQVIRHQLVLFLDEQGPKDLREICREIWEDDEMFQKAKEQVWVLIEDDVLTITPDLKITIVKSPNSFIALNNARSELLHQSIEVPSVDHQKLGEELAKVTYPWPTETIKQVDESVSKAAHDIRQYYFSHLPHLRLLPYLMLEADGRGGWRDDYSRAYNHFLYPIHQEHETWGSYDMFIELRTGIILSSTSGDRSALLTDLQDYEVGDDIPWGVASDHEIFAKLSHQGDRFDPLDWVTYLLEACKNEYHNRPEEVAKSLIHKQELVPWIDRKLAEIPLDKIYSTLRKQGYDL